MIMGAPEQKKNKICGEDLKLEIIMMSALGQYFANRVLCFFIKYF